MKGLANLVGQMVFSLSLAGMGPVSTGYYGYAIVFSITGVLYVVASVYFLLIFRNVDKQNQRDKIQIN